MFLKYAPYIQEMLKPVWFRLVRVRAQYNQTLREQLQLRPPKPKPISPVQVQQEIDSTHRADPLALQAPPPMSPDRVREEITRTLRGADSWNLAQEDLQHQADSPNEEPLTEAHVIDAGPWNHATRVACPHCDLTMAYSAQVAGKPSICSRCLRTFTMPSPMVEQAPAMPVKIRRPNKAAMLLGIAMCLFGFLLLSTEDPVYSLTGGWLIVCGIIGVVIGKFGAWWNHG